MEPHYLGVIEEPPREERGPSEHIFCERLVVILKTWLLTCRNWVIANKSLGPEGV